MPLVVGAAAGVALAAAAGRIMQSQGQLPSDLRLDLPIYALGMAIFAVVVLVAAITPALRALRINPATALHWEQNLRPIWWSSRYFLKSSPTPPSPKMPRNAGPSESV